MRNTISENDFNFTWNIKINGNIETREIIENGSEINVDEKNKGKFVNQV